MDKQKILIIAISVTLFLFVQLFIFDELEESQQREILSTYDRGYDQGAIDAVTSVFSQIEDCQVASITLFNSTKEVFDRSCLVIESPEP